MRVEDLLALNLPIFEGVSAEQLSALPLTVRERNFRKWETVFSHEDRTSDVYILVSGALLAVFWTKEGREIIFSRFSEGSYFGELAALSDTRRSLTVTCRTKARLLVIPQQSFLTLFEEVPKIRQRVVQGLVGRIHALTSRLVEQTALTVEQRAASHLIALAAEQGVLRDGGVISNVPTHAEMAAYLGANREMITRVLGRLSKRGAIKGARKEITLLDIDELSDCLGS
ncbi:Crp/Fnr family transcriptional regulator [Jannaschia aquimarina]|uniref:Crp_2 protein n=1 Tax=Jannaschia aquimarina TaxID=935700 RepID=A0A0D1ECU2_9RHOB|nr:Crp/Fnr family transcriptional regulator [Jannaschia aquimarina]KIT14751.1 cAMP receptor protein [Jannaschia aquimarina]SNS76233.1 cAMP-binding domain of CRP or a regulatory subunit of cAMP-dependent protein kinases [Jannaschia aquimarina]